MNEPAPFKVHEVRAHRSARRRNQPWIKPGIGGRDNRGDIGHPFANEAQDLFVALHPVPDQTAKQLLRLGHRGSVGRIENAVAALPQCLQCHGDPAAQSETLRAKLKQYYPDDEAVGYKAGEWRGVIRVTVADAPTK